MDEVARLRARVAELESRLNRFAHDCNNILTNILGHSSLLEATSDPGSEAHDTARVIRRAAERAGELTRHLREPNGGERRAVDLHETLREVGALLGGAAGSHIRIHYEFDGDKGLVGGNPGQLHQMLLNLAMNACEAMPGDGDLVFATRPRDEELVVEIRDTGRGIPIEYRERIFEPSFTTKPGKGAGMGLAIVHAIVDGHGGRVEVESEPGQGTTVRLRLPRQIPRAAGA